MTGSPPDLDLSKGPLVIDIGHLGGPDHRDAFIIIFEAVCVANQDLIGSISANAGDLYDSAKEFVDLEAGPRCPVLRVGFDNPRFAIVARLDGLPDRPRYLPYSG